MNQRKNNILYELEKMGVIKAEMITKTYEGGFRKIRVYRMNEEYKQLFQDLIDNKNVSYFST